MPNILSILLALILPLIWNVFLVIYLGHHASEGKLSPLKFTSTFVLGFSTTVSMILFIVISSANGIRLREVGFVAFVFLINFIISFPVVYYLSRFFLKNFFTKWSSEIKIHKGEIIKDIRK